jgi:lambda family phage portal protein
VSRLARWSARLDAAVALVSPEWGLRRARARGAGKVVAKHSRRQRHYEAAQGGRRTQGWYRVTGGDANTANSAALATLRELSRDLRRNNGWARGGVRAITRNTVGWGITPKAIGGTPAAARATDLWKVWSAKSSCDFDGRLNFAGLQRLVMDTVVESGEAIILMQPASTKDGLPVPVRIQVLEPEYLDTNRATTAPLESGGWIIDGVEFDAAGRRVAYWLFTTHPGSRVLTTTTNFESERVAADRVLHVYLVERPGQVRGVPWIASAITRIKDLDDFEDAEIMQQKVAACFGAFVTDTDGTATGIAGDEVDDNGDPIDALEPGHIAYLTPGKTVTFAQPPTAQDGAFTVRALRRIAASLGVTYEDMTGDYSTVNFSSARMGRLAHWQNVSDWRWNMLVPQLCDAVWCWVMTMASDLEGWDEVPCAQWNAPPMPILEPDKEAAAAKALVRIGALTWPQMVRELGEDPDEQMQQIAESNKALDKLGIILDCDPRRANAGGGAQTVGGEGTAPVPGEDAPAAPADGESESDQVEGEEGDEPPPEPAPAA